MIAYVLATAIHLSDYCNHYKAHPDGSWTCLGTYDDDLWQTQKDTWPGGEDSWLAYRRANGLD